MSSNYILLVAFHVWPHKAYLAQGDKWISVVQQYITALIVYPLENLKNNSSELFSSFCILTICFINQGTWWHKLFECFKDWAILWYLFGSLFYRVQCHYNVLNFLQKSHNRHPIPCPWGQGMGCILWVQSLLQVLYHLLQFSMQYNVTVVTVTCPSTCWNLLIFGMTSLALYTVVPVIVFSGSLLNI